MAKCKNCGAELPPGAKVCVYCGTAAETPPAPAPQPQPQPQPQPAAPQPQAEQDQEVEVLLSSVALKNPGGTKIISAPLGFSWTTLFFGGIVFLFRKDWKMFFIWCIIQCAMYFSTYGDPEFDAIDDAWAAFIVNLVFAFIYNKMYIKALIAKGWKPVSKSDRFTLRSKGIAA